MRRPGVAPTALAFGLLTAGIATAQSNQDPLFEAVQRRDAAAVTRLVANGADVNASRPDGSTPLAWASLRDDVEIASALLAAGADPNATDENGETPLLLASARGNLTIARQLLEAGARIDVARWSGDTPLLAAARSGETELVELLLDAGADVDAREERMGQTPLMWAIAGESPEVATLLIRHGAQVDASSTNGFLPILFAARQGDAASARALIAALPGRAAGDHAAGADPHVAAPDGQTPFLLALAGGHDEVVTLMLDQGADVQTRDERGATPLHAAARQGKTDLVEELVSRGADLQARTTGAPTGGAARQTSGLTPFLTAALAGQTETMRTLARLGADATTLSNEGAGAVLLASRSREHDAVVLAVTELGLDVNATPPGQPSALHTAIRFGEDETVEFLVEAGADLEALDHHGRTPLGEAEYEAPTHTIELMRRLVAERQ